MANDQLIGEEKIRYKRNIIIPEVGEKGQLMLKKSSVLIVGGGGLGSASSLYLAAAGVGRIGIVDSDKVEISNLQRQIIHSTSSLGIPKVHSAKDKLADLNPLISLETYHQRITDRNVNEILANYQVVVDATDNFETRYLLNRACVKAHKTFIYGAVYQFYGQMSVFDTSKGPCFRCIFRIVPKGADSQANEEIGVIGAIPGTIGTLQAVEAIKILIGIGIPAYGKLILYDGLEMKFQEIAIKKDPDCNVCGSIE